MQASRVEILMEKLIGNSLSVEELEELLVLVDHAEEEISEVLRQYFDKLVNGQ